MKKFILFLHLFIFYFNSHGQCYMKAQSDEGQESYTTGSKKLDELINQEVKTMNLVFNVNYYWMIYEGTNASANNLSKILIGKSLMLDQFVKTDGFKSIIAILAHEFGHALQYKYNMDVYGGWGGKWCELHADYLAGWYMGMKQYFSAEKLSNNELNKVFRSFFDLGDYQYNDPGHHGTKEERFTAFIGGYNEGIKNQSDLNTAYMNGQDYVINIDKMVPIYYPEKAESKNSSNYNNNNSNTSGTGFLCIYGNSKKALKAELFLGDQYVGNLSNYVIGSAPNYGENGTISLKVPPGNYQIGIKWPSGVFGRNYTIKFKYINVQSNYVTKLLVSDED